MSVRYSPNMLVMINAAEKASRALRRDFGEVEQLQVSKKGVADFVTSADLRAEKILREELEKARPDFGFLLEEGGEVEGENPEYRYIIDPLDGTFNFMHGIPHWCISVGLEHKGEIIAGVVIDPIRDETFWAEKNKGSFMNNKRLRVSNREQLEVAALATIIPGRGWGDFAKYAKELGPLTMQTNIINSMGSAALDLCYVAAGRFDGYWSCAKLKPWDVAAASLIIKEAGGFISDKQGRKEIMDDNFIVAGNNKIHTALLKNIKESRQAEKKSA